ncbi:amidase family protein [Sulfitobacter sp. HNIBRBA3233]|uniref:amidase n=1 Tax=Sulfitobacter marinivivus TaxID=3158558 RepID=UPI0032DFD7C2
MSYPSYTGPELCARSASDIVQLLKRREIAPADLIDAAAERHAQTDPAINAMPTACFDRARDAAKTMTTPEEDDPRELHGLPLGIKDLTPVAGVRCTYGTPGLADYIPDASDPLVRRIEARGGLVIGKTNTPEFGAGANTFNAVLGTTRNPWDTRLNPAGSSGGAAAQLIAGQAWLSHGSDHGGSLRTPAAYCGVVGLRTSPGLVGGGPDDAGFIIEGLQGPMARNVRDCALFLDAMAGFDPVHPISFPADTSGPYQAAVDRAEGRLRIAWSADLGGQCPVDTDMEEHLEGVMALLARDGHAVETPPIEMPQMKRTYYTLRGILWASLMRDIDPAIRAGFKPTLEDNVRRGMALTMDDIVDAQKARTKIYHELRQLLEHHDVLACPVVGNMPKPVEVEWVSEAGGQKFDFYMDWLAHAFPATVAGLPAMSIPVGLTSGGLPVGLQLIGRPRGEAALLAAAALVEVSVGGPLRVIDPVVRHEG